MSFTSELAISLYVCLRRPHCFDRLRSSNSPQTLQFTTSVGKENCSHIYGSETKSTIYSSGITFALNKGLEMILEGDL